MVIFSLTYFFMTQYNEKKTQKMNEYLLPPLLPSEVNLIKDKLFL